MHACSVFKAVPFFAKARRVGVPARTYVDVEESVLNQRTIDVRPVQQDDHSLVRGMLARSTCTRCSRAPLLRGPDHVDFDYLTLNPTSQLGKSAGRGAP